MKGEKKRQTDSQESDREKKQRRIRQVRRRNKKTDHKVNQL